MNIGINRKEAAAERKQAQQSEVDEQAQGAKDAPETQPEPAAESEAAEQNAAADAARIEQLEAECEKYHDMAARLQAEFNNFRNRNQNTRAEGYEEGNIDCVKELLPILDNFERAVQAAEAAGESESMINGFKMIRKQLRDALAKRGMTELVPLGEKFDPNVHNAVFRVSAEEAEGEPGTIAAVLQTGYAVNGRIIRHPMVKVIED